MTTQPQIKKRGHPEKPKHEKIVQIVIGVRQKYYREAEREMKEVAKKYRA